MNLYAYVGNDPVNFTDPLGLQKEEPPIVVTCDYVCQSEANLRRARLAYFLDRPFDFGFTVELIDFGIGGEYGHWYPTFEDVAPPTCAVPSEAVPDIASRFAYAGQNPNKPIEHDNTWLAPCLGYLVVRSKHRSSSEAGGQLYLR